MVGAQETMPWKAVVRAAQLRPKSWLLRELRTWYPAAIILYGFFDTTHLQAILSRDTFWATAAIIVLTLPLVFLLGKGGGKVAMDH